MSEYNVLINKYDAVNAQYDQLYPQPMKHANTHAKDGSDPITLSSIGAAPSGFGFGETLAQVRTVSADETYETYCAKLDAVLAGMGDSTSKLIGFYPPAIYGWGTQIGLLYKANSNNASIRSLGNYDGVKNGFFGVSMRKVKGVWQPMEWINPPMILGVEYRTTERYNGSPVYLTLQSDGIVHKRIENGTDITPITYGTSDLSAGTSPLTTGMIYFVYE